MKKIQNTILGITFAFGILICIITQVFKFEGKLTAKQYREEYREQGREQIRAEAIEIGVAIFTKDGFRWRIDNTIGMSTNSLKALKALKNKLNKRSEDVKDN